MLIWEIWSTDDMKNWWKDYESPDQQKAFCFLASKKFKYLFAEIRTRIKL